MELEFRIGTSGRSMKLMKQSFNGSLLTQFCICNTVFFFKRDSQLCKFPILTNTEASLGWCVKKYHTECVLLVGF